MNLEINKTFGKAEKLCSQSVIDELFLKGSSFIAYPLRVVFACKPTSDEEAPSISVLVSVSKKKFKRAVKRNRVKRLTREAYRLNKDILVPIVLRERLHIDIAFVYLDSTILSFEEFDKAMKKVARVLTERTNTIQ
ncbi:ribonuclease P protein component [Dysgonomonas massiliensis]|uniref:ribonuclease P protein component n=1 Tax=Dysgonomonas massiliensis TaxID=2040292 RepID=UPI000C78B4A7|nr:ribonuclease P protein component [Dysgonomonas massiliensis]